jgi:hypothetical protein
MKARIDKNRETERVRFISKYKADKLREMLSHVPLPGTVFERCMLTVTGYRTGDVYGILDNIEYQSAVMLLSDSPEGKFLRKRASMRFILETAFNMEYVYGKSKEDMLMNDAALRKICRENINIDKNIDEMNEHELACACAYFNEIKSFRQVKNKLINR